jgi:hypothetical protein
VETVGSQPGTWRDIGCFLRERDRRTGGVDCARFSGLGELSGVQKAVTEDTVALSAATKKKKAATRRQEPNQVACTELGCHPIPPGCHPQMGYNWDGIPTGFDIVVCQPPRVR